MFKYRVALQSIFFQGLAAVFTMLTTYFVSKKTGASGQGEWAVLKSNVEFISAAMSFGFPVSYTYFINNRNANGNALFKKYIVFLAITSPLICFFLSAGVIHTPGIIDGNMVFYVLLVSMFISYYSNVRGLVLASGTILSFNLISLLLPASIFMFFIILNVSTPKDIVDAYGMACLFIFIVSVLFHLRNGSSSGVDIKNKEFYINSIWNFSANIGPYLYVIIINQWMVNNGFSYDELGVISIVLLINGSVLLIPNILGPLLYREWSIEPKRILATYKKTIRLFIFISLILVLAISPVLSFAIEFLLGNKFSQAITPAKILMLSVPFSFAVRVLINACLAVGCAKENAIILNMKNALIMLLLIIFSPNELISISLILSAAEVIYFLCFAFVVKSKLGCTFMFLVGVKDAN